MMPSAAESGDFSLVLGGPFFQLLRRAHLSGNGLELLVCRVIVMSLLAWAAAAGVVGRGKTRLGRERQGAGPLRLEMYCA